MYKILELREKLKVIYSGYSMYIDAAFKFILALAGMILINSNIGTMGVLQNPLVVVAISLACAVLPKALMVMILMFTIVGHVYSMALEPAIMILVIFMLMYLLFFRFTSKESFILIIVPIMFFLKVPYIVPLIVGLIATPISVVSVAFGTLVYFILAYIGQNYEEFVKVAGEDGFKALTMLVDGIFENTALYFTIAVLGVVISLVYVVKRLSVDYSWIVAVCAGGVMQLVLFLMGNVMLEDMSIVCSVVSTIVGGLFSVVLAWFLQFFIHSVDYTRTEKVQFEDDDYYYYVKAVPKVKVSSSQVKVKRVNAKRVSRVQQSDK